MIVITLKCGEDLTTSQLASNQDAARLLFPGKRYVFEPCVTATGLPMPQYAKTVKPAEFDFTLGKYVGFINDKHVFEGYPKVDTRRINLKMKLCFFHVLFVGGAKIIPHS